MAALFSRKGALKPLKICNVNVHSFTCIAYGQSKLVQQDVDYMADTSYSDQEL